MKRRLLRLLRWLLVLVLLFAVLEGAAALWLRGRSSHFIIPGESDGAPAWTENPFFSSRFAIPRTAVPPPPLVASRDDADRPFRVCVLTDSTPLGLEYADFSYPRQLEHLLRARCPGVPVEVLHMTQLGANSHILREIARDLRLLKPDAVVVVCGNDEISGPFGPAAPPVWAPSPFTGWFTTRFSRPLVLFTRLRLAQAAAILAGRCFPDRTDRAIWTSREPQLMLGRLHPGAPALDAAREAYGDNLDAIFALARAASPVVIACTTPVNLRDCGPLNIHYSPDSETAQLNREALFRAIANEETMPDESRRLYEAILLRNPLHAEALYRYGLFSLHHGHDEEGARLLSAARDNDTLRIRCDSTLNRILDDAADRADIDILDAEELFASLSPGHAPGHELFLDPIHMTFEGHYRMAEAILARLDALGALPQTEGSPQPLPSPERLADDMFYHPWSHAAVLAAVHHRMLSAPYLNQPGYADAFARLVAEKNAVDSQIAALPGANAQAIHLRHRRSRPDDPWLAVRAARFFLRTGHCDEAAEAADTALRFWPHRTDVRALRILADLLRHRPNAEAEAMLREAGETDPEIAAEQAAIHRYYALDIETKRPAKEIGRDTKNFDESLTDEINDRLLDWAVALLPEEADREDTPWPSELVKDVRGAHAEVLEAQTALDSASNALDSASATLEKRARELDEANTKRTQLSDELERLQADLNSARTTFANDPMAAAQALSDRIRQTDRIQSEELATQVDIQIAERRLDSAKGKFKDRQHEMDEASGVFEDALRNQGAAIRELRRAYLKARERRIAEEPDTGDDRVDWLDFPDLWGPRYPEVLALLTRVSGKAARNAAAASEHAHTELMALDAGRSARLLAMRDELVGRLFAETLPRLSPSSRSFPFDVTGCLAIGTVLHERGRHSLAVPWLRRALDLDPGNADAALMLSKVLYALSMPDYDEAFIRQSLDVLESTLKRLPSNPVLWEELGTQYCLISEWVPSNEAFNRADALAPFRYQRFYRRAWALEDVGEHVRAYRTLRQYMDFVPGDPIGPALLETISESLPDGFVYEEKPVSSRPSLLDSLKD